MPDTEVCKDSRPCPGSDRGLHPEVETGKGHRAIQSTIEIQRNSLPVAENQGGFLKETSLKAFQEAVPGHGEGEGAHILMFRNSEAQKRAGWTRKNTWGQSSPCTSFYIMSLNLTFLMGTLGITVSPTSRAIVGIKWDGIDTWLCELKGAPAWAHVTRQNCVVGPLTGVKCVWGLPIRM